MRVKTSVIRDYRNNLSAKQLALYIYICRSAKGNISTLNVTSLSRNASISRQHIYNCLEVLTKHNLISVHSDGRGALHAIINHKVSKGDSYILLNHLSLSAKHLFNLSLGQLLLILRVIAFKKNGVKINQRQLDKWGITIYDKDLHGICFDFMKEKWVAKEGFLKPEEGSIWASLIQICHKHHIPYNSDLLDHAVTKLSYRASSYISESIQRLLDGIKRRSIYELSAAYMLSV